MPPAQLPKDAGMRWYAVNTQANSETRAKLNLERQGWACFLPLVSSSIRVRTRMVERIRPLFGGYLFLAMDAGQSRWRSIDSTFGVRSILKRGDIPIPLPVGCVEALSEMTDNAGRFTFSSRLSEGDQVRFLRGPFAGFVGTLEKVGSHGRIRVLLELLGRQSAIQGKASEVEPVTDHAA